MSFIKHASVAVIVVSAASVVSAADFYTTNFDSFSTSQSYAHPHNVNAGTGGTVNGQDGWTANIDQGHIDEQIVEVAPGNNVLRVSNYNASGNYALTHPAPAPLTAAGESVNGATRSQFSFSFDFRTALPTAQEGLRVDVTPFEFSTAARQGLLRLHETATNGLVAEWFSSTGTAGFPTTILATNLARDQWHSISVDMLFVDGAANDVVTINLNGSETTSTTWEQYYADPATPAAEPEFAAVDSVIFRVPTAGTAGLQGNGLYIDNFTMAVPEPTSIGLLAAAGLIGLRRRR